MVKIWYEPVTGEWCVLVEGTDKIFVYGTMRSALNRVERELKGMKKEE